MVYFTPAYAQFFKDLTQNNQTEWFQENKKIYEKEVKKPFAQLMEDLLMGLKELDPEIDMKPNQAVFRINRDIRFSKDKTPYNTLMKAGFAKGGRKSSYAGYYLGISADHIHVGGGSFGLDTESLKKVREHIVYHTDTFLKLVNEPSFVKTFGSVKGERIKRIPTEYQDTFAQTELVANKQFYYMADYDAKDLLTSDKLLDFILDHFRQITPLNQFLKAALD